MDQIKYLMLLQDDQIGEENVWCKVDMKLGAPLSAVLCGIKVSHGLR